MKKILLLVLIVLFLVACPGNEEVSPVPPNASQSSVGGENTSGGALVSEGLGGFGGDENDVGGQGEEEMASGGSGGEESWHDSCMDNCFNNFLDCKESCHQNSSCSDLWECKKDCYHNKRDCQELCDENDCK